VSPSEHLCPRRAESAINFPGPDRWEARHGLVHQSQVGMSCSHCGSLHPDRFMELVREGWIVGPTDKNYKAYLHEPVTDEHRAQRKAAWEASDFGRFIRKHVLDEGGTEAEAQAKVDEYWRRDEEPHLSGSRSAKFYYQHLSAEQQHEFIELHNSKAMQIGWPGRFYIQPFFCGSAPAGEENADG